MMMIIIKIEIPPVFVVHTELGLAGLRWPWAGGFYMPFSSDNFVSPLDPFSVVWIGYK